MSMNFVRVGDLSEQIRGVTYGKEDASKTPTGGYLPVLRAGNITDQGLLFDDLVYVPAGRISTKQKLRTGDIVVAASSGSLDVVGKTAKVLHDFDGGFGAFCKVLRPNSRVEPNYFAQFFKTPNYRRTISALASGANINNLRNEHLDELLVPLPPLPEQRRIAAILDQADALRAKRREALAQLNSLTQSIFIEMFGDPVSNSRGWKIASLGDLVSKLGSGATPTGGDAAYKESGISLIRSLNVHDGEFVYKNLAFIDEVQAGKLSNVVVEEGDVLLNITGASVARVCSVPKSVLPARVNQHVMIVRPNSTLNRIYLERLLLNPQMKARLLQVGGAGATREAITKAQAAELAIPLPPLDLQGVFAQRVSAVQKLQSCGGQSLKELDALFASLQHRAFRGEL